MRRVHPALANSSKSLPVLFVGQHDGLQLWYSYTGSNGYYIVISSEVPRRELIAWDLVLILIPIFIVVVPLSVILFMTFVSTEKPTLNIYISLDVTYLHLFRRFSTLNSTLFSRFQEDAHCFWQPIGKPKDVLTSLTVFQKEKYQRTRTLQVLVLTVLRPTLKMKHFPCALFA